MSRLIQIARNSFIRLEGLLYQFFGLFKKLFSWSNQLFNFLSKLLGIAESQYLLEDQPQPIKQAEAEPKMPEATPQYSPPAAIATRRRPDTNMDYFLKLARQTKNSK